MIHEMPVVEECVREYLVPLEAISWNEEDVPLGQRGVRFSWLYDFVAKIWNGVDTVVADMWNQYRSNEKAAMFGPWNIPSPENPLYSEDLVESLRTTRQLVSNLIVPVTSPIKAPLYARVPKEHRGRPSVFLSHTWNSSCVEGGHGSLDIMLDHYRDSFVWIDIACYNQHSLKDESIAGDMSALISGIGHVAFILTKEPFFTRSWCMWEIISGHQTGSEVKVHDQSARIRKKYWSTEIDQLPPKFRSISDLDATERKDQDKIFKLLVSTFGSVDKANEYVRNILPAQW
jgi:hypothetical protein